MRIKIAEPSTKDLRSFGLIFGGIVAILFGLLLPFIFDYSFSIWPWYVLGVFAVLAMLSPILLKPVYYIWMFFGLMMSKITTPLLMGLVFFVIIFPFGFIMRLFGYNPLSLKIDSNLETYRTSSDEISKENLGKPF